MSCGILFCLKFKRKKLRVGFVMKDGFENTNRSNNKKLLPGLILFVILVFMFVCWIYYVWNKVPASIYLRAGNAEEFDFSVPATANIDRSTVDLGRPVTLYTDEMEDYTMQVKLFGVIDFKKTQVKVIEDVKLYPIGLPVGIYVKTDGILVLQSGEFIGEDGTTKYPAKELEKGDYILSVNGTEVQSKIGLMSMVEECEGEPLEMLINRNGQEITLFVFPEKNEDGEYKLGIWIRDNAQGVGTMTYMDEKCNFGALGHGINDIDTCELMNMEYGRLYDTEIIAIKKGEEGEPGEITGFIAYEKERQVGEIYVNSSCGIYGSVTDNFCSREDVQEIISDESNLLPVGLKQDIKLGNAHVYCAIESEPKYYDILITEIYRKSEETGRSMKIEVVDPELLEKTGGIIQGLSGSPIIQEGKIIGAVTHVLVNDPKRGYGIFIENMLEH